jgi:hypothetical protein
MAAESQEKQTQSKPIKANFKGKKKLKQNHFFTSVISVHDPARGST